MTDTMTDETDNIKQLNRLLFNHYVLNNPKMLKAVLEKGANPNIKWNDEQTPLEFLLQLVYNGDKDDEYRKSNIEAVLESCKILLEAGANFLEINKKKDYLSVQSAILSKSNKVNKLLKFLDKQGLDFVNFTENFSPLGYVHCLDLVQFLINKGVDVNGKNSDSTATLSDSNRPSLSPPLLIATYYENKDVLEYAKILIENGADVNLPSPDNEVLLHHAVDRHPELANYLLDVGADPKIENYGGENSLDLLLNTISFYSNDKNENFPEYIKLKSRIMKMMGLEDLDL